MKPRQKHYGQSDGEHAPRLSKPANHAGDGEEFYRAVCDTGLEGVANKRRDSRYFQVKSRAWLKAK